MNPHGFKQRPASITKRQIPEQKSQEGRDTKYNDAESLTDFTHTAETSGDVQALTAGN